ncbi:hypothetical protein EJ110_NYTH45709 [Nymphaea thermarum]|nr:hypothetical protein EJ110_NYTH45709 [Nymphaea thermarum]
MEENGYRPPQFSEDTAWVPVWLQSCRVSSLSQQARRADSFPQSTNNVEWPPETLGDGQEPIREGAANNNIELFLSGDDICSVGNSLSKESVQPFQLHLSSDVSEHSLNQYYESCGASLSSRGTVHPKFTPDCLVVKNLEGPCEKLRNTVPMANSEAQVTNMQKYHICPEPDNNNSERRNFSIGFLENADADSAIELSIVASEALSISDMVCSSLPSEACATSAVLEIALKVKEARIQACVSNADVSLISSEEVEEVDALSDLDEEAMKHTQRSQCQYSLSKAGGLVAGLAGAAVCDLLVFFVVISPFVFYVPSLPRDPCRCCLGICAAVASGSMPPSRVLRCCLGIYAVVASGSVLPPWGPCHHRLGIHATTTISRSVPPPRYSRHRLLSFLRCSFCVFSRWPTPYFLPLLMSRARAAISRVRTSPYMLLLFG